MKNESSAGTSADLHGGAFDAGTTVAHAVGALDDTWWGGACDAEECTGGGDADGERYVPLGPLTVLVDDWKYTGPLPPPPLKDEEEKDDEENDDIAGATASEPPR